MIDNITWGSEGITTQVGGTTFTHTPDCALNTGQMQIDDDWMNACSCFISRIRIVAFPDGTKVPLQRSTAEMAEGKTYPEWRKLVDERAEAISQARFWRKIAIVCAAVMTLDSVLAVGSFSGWW